MPEILFAATITPSDVASFITVKLPFILSGSLSACKTQQWLPSFSRSDIHNYGFTTHLYGHQQVVNLPYGNCRPSPKTWCVRELQKDKGEFRVSSSFAILVLTIIQIKCVFESDAAIRCKMCADSGKDCTIEQRGAKTFM